MNNIEMSALQARKFMLLSQGLLGPYRYRGEKGIIEFVRRSGCVQYDPVNVCGRSPEISLHSRVEGYTHESLDRILYDKRSLVEYFDKNVAYIPREDWPMFSRIRDWHKRSSRRRDIVAPYEEEFRQLVKERGVVSSRELDDGRRVKWVWSVNTKLAKAVLENLYFNGKLAVHHREGVARFYMDAREALGDVYGVPDPYPHDADWFRAMILRRVGAVGLLWNAGSDAWLCILNMKSADRMHAFAELCESGELIEVKVQDISKPFCI